MNARVIDHQQAIKGMMAERYLLGELTEGELNAFEEHLFECPACLEQVQAGNEFVGYLKRIGAEEPVPASQPGWRQRIAQMFGPVPAVVFAVLFLCAGSFSVYQGIVLRRMAAPQVVAVETLHPDSRGTKVITAPSHGFFELRAMLSGSPQESNAYKAQIVDAGEKEVIFITINESLNDAVQIRLNAGAFHNGNYSLVITTIDKVTGNTKNVSKYPFELKLQD